MENKIIPAALFVGLVFIINEYSPRAAKAILVLILAGLLLNNGDKIQKMITGR